MNFSTIFEIVEDLFADLFSGIFHGTFFVAFFRNFHNLLQYFKFFSNFYHFYGVSRFFCCKYLEKGFIFWWGGKGCFYPKVWNCTTCPRQCLTRNLTCVEADACKGGCYCLPPFYETNRGYCVLSFTEVCQAESALGLIQNTTAQTTTTAPANGTNAVA